MADVIAGFVFGFCIGVVLVFCMIRVWLKDILLHELTTVRGFLRDPEFEFEHDGITYSLRFFRIVYEHRFVNGVDKGVHTIVALRESDEDDEKVRELCK